GMLREVERVLAPGGRFVVLPALGPRPSDPLGSLVWDMDRRLDPGGRRHDDPDHLERLAPHAGLRVLAARPLAAVGYLEEPGDEGFGLALRLARAGEHVVIKSKMEEKRRAAAEKALRILGQAAPVDGTSNAKTAAACDVVLVTVPYAAQADIYRSIRDAVRQ